MKNINAIACDIGGVMVIGNNFKTHYSPLCKYFKIDIEKFLKIYHKYVHPASRGKISSKKMIFSLADKFEINRKDFLNKWIFYKKKSIIKNFELEKFLKKLKKKYKVVCFSGVLDLHYKLNNEKKIYDVFDLKILSYRVKTNKPDIKIYKILLKKLGISPEEILFIDDNEICLVPAKKLGIRTLLYKNNPQLFRDFSKLEKYK